MSTVIWHCADQSICASLWSARGGTSVHAFATTSPASTVHNHTGLNYRGHNYRVHDYRVHHYLGHYYLGHNYKSTDLVSDGILARVRLLHLYSRAHRLTILAELHTQLLAMERQTAKPVMPWISASPTACKTLYKTRYRHHRRHISISAPPAALREYMCAGTQNDRPGESFSTTNSKMSTSMSTRMSSSLPCSAETAKPCRVPHDVRMPYTHGQTPLYRPSPMACR